LTGSDPAFMQQEAMESAIGIVLINID